MDGQFDEQTHTHTHTHTHTPLSNHSCVVERRTSAVSVGWFTKLYSYSSKRLNLTVGSKADFSCFTILR